jgi:hypothetical protein
MYDGPLSLLILFAKALSAAYDAGSECEDFHPDDEAMKLLMVLDAEQRAAEVPALEWLASVMVNSYPGIAVIRALDKQAPGLRGVFAPPRAVIPQDDGA